MADKRLIPEGIRDLSTEAFNELIDRLGSIDLTPLLVYLIDYVTPSALPHLAEQFHVTGLEGWELAETEEEKRALIKKAIELHRYRGTPWAVKEALKAVGFEADIYEWFQELPYPYNTFFGDISNAPYEFFIVVNCSKMFGKDVLLSGENQQRLISLINEYKNLRSHLNKLVLYPKYISKTGYTDAMTKPVSICNAYTETQSNYLIPVSLPYMTSMHRPVAVIYAGEVINYG